MMGYSQGLSILTSRRAALRGCAPPARRGVQNGSISCVALVLSVPGGTRAILGENSSRVLTSRSPGRSHRIAPDPQAASSGSVPAGKGLLTVRLLGEAPPDNTFVGGNFDADDLDEGSRASATGSSTRASSQFPRRSFSSPRGCPPVRRLFAGSACHRSREESASRRRDTRARATRPRPGADVEAARTVFARGVWRWTRTPRATAPARDVLGHCRHAAAARVRRLSATSSVIDPTLFARPSRPNEYSVPGTHRSAGSAGSCSSLPHVSRRRSPR